MDLIEIRPDFDADPAGHDLANFLAAQRAYERASLRRTLLVHATAVLGLPVWLAALGYFAGIERGVVLGAFALSLVALALAAAVEQMRRSDAATAGRRLRMERRSN